MRTQNPGSDALYFLFYFKCSNYITQYIQWRKFNRYLISSTSDIIFNATHAAFPYIIMATQHGNSTISIVLHFQSLSVCSSTLCHSITFATSVTKIVQSYVKIQPKGSASGGFIGGFWAHPPSMSQHTSLDILAHLLKIAAHPKFFFGFQLWKPRFL